YKRIIIPTHQAIVAHKQAIPASKPYSLAVLTPIATKGSKRGAHWPNRSAFERFWRGLGGLGCLGIFATGAGFGLTGTGLGAGTSTGFATGISTGTGFGSGLGSNLGTGFGSGFGTGFGSGLEAVLGGGVALTGFAGLGAATGFGALGIGLKERTIFS